MKIVPKAQYGRPLVAQSDNTRVARPVLVERIKYTPRPDEFFITDRRTGKKVLVKRKNETVSADNRSTYQRQQDQTKSKQIYRQYEEDKKQEEGMKNLQGFLTFVSPSTYIGPVFNNNGKSYAENVMSGEGTGSTAGNVAIDILTPFAVGGAKSLTASVARKLPYRLSVPVSSDKYYRVVGMDAIDDANKSGLIRWQPTSTNSLQDNNLGKKSLLEKLEVGSRSGGVPYFTKGKLYMPPQQGQAVIVGNRSIPWRRIGPKGRVNKYSPEDPISKGNSATPYINEQFNIASTGAFEYWTRGNNFITKHLYKRYSFDSGSDYTNRLLQLLGNSKSNRNLGTFNYITQQFANYLQSRGIDISKFSSDDLLRLQSIRRKSLLQSSPNSEYIAVQQGGTTTPQTSYTLRSQNHIDLADMEMIGNRVGNLEAIQPGHQSSEKLYNAGIRLNPKGIISGDLLLSPEITYNIWKKFPDKRIIGKQGTHTFNYGRDVIKKGNSYTIHNGNQVLLKSPTDLTLPIKSESTFDPTIIDVFNYKLKFPNWYDSNIYK